MNHKRTIASAACLMGILGVSTAWLLKSPQTASTRNLSDEALLALIKNDQAAFKSVIAAGVNLQDSLPMIDGQTYSIAEGIAHFERDKFLAHLHAKKIPYVNQKQGKAFDIMTLAISRNNLEVLSELAKENPQYGLSYGEKGWSLLHLASSTCAHKLTGILHEKGKLNWDLRAKDGSTPLTLAAQSDCLPMLSYWKEHGADFKRKDGRGLTALAILKKKKDAALVAFAESFEPKRVPASKPVLVDFYKKRKIPKDQIVDHSALIEPEDRPLEATETAEYSEFAD